MSIRRTHKDFVRSQQKNAANRERSTKLRSLVQSSAMAAKERFASRVQWWQRAFRTPLVGFYGWVKSQCRTLWAACLSILGLKRGSQPSSLKGRSTDIKSRKKAAGRRLIHESMEPRQLLASDFAVIANDTFAQEDPSASPFPNTGQFTVQLQDGVGAPMAATEDLTVTYSLTGEANSEEGVDYIAEVSSSPIPAGSFTISKGQTNAVIDIDVQDDLLYDGGNEDVKLTVTSVAGTSTSLAMSGSGFATMEIVDNEAAPVVSLSASDPSAAEPSDKGEFTITQSVPADTDTTVSVAYSGTADASDYATSGTSFTIDAGKTEATSDVTPSPDVLVEGDETVVASITSVSGIDVTKGSSSDSVTIADTEDKAVVSIIDNGDTTATETPLIDNAKFTIEQTEASSTETVVKYVVGGDAQEGVDYTFGVIDEDESANSIAGPQGGSGPQGLAGFSLAPNSNIANSTTVPHVTVNSQANDGTGDVFAFYTSTGGAATFDIDASSKFNSVLELFDATGKLLAVNDDSGSIDAPGSTTKDDSFLSFSLPSDGVYYVRVTESVGGNKGSAGPNAGAAVGAEYELHFSVPGSAGYAVIGAGDKSVDLPIIVNDSTYSFDDSIIEANEEVEVKLDSIVNADPQISLSSTAADLEASATIIDNDEVKVSITGTKDAVEPSTDGEFIVSLPAGVTSSAPTVVTLGYDKLGSTSKNASTATADDTQDHKLADSFTVTIPVGKNSVAVPVEIIDNPLIEEDETAKLSITKITNADTKLAISGVGNADEITIGDNDTATVDVDATFAPAAENGSNGTFTFFLSEPPGFPTGKPAVADRDTTVTFNVSDLVTSGSPTGLGEDYKLSGPTLTDLGGGKYQVVINAFDSSADVTVEVIDDDFIEGTETLKVSIDTLEAPTDSNIKIGLGSPADTMDILDDDGLTVKIVGTKGAVEGSVVGEFTLSTDGTGESLAPTIVTYEVVTKLSTAVEGDDFKTLTGTATIPMGKAGQTTIIEIDPTGAFNDILAEGTEVVTVKITGVTGTGMSIDAMDQDSIDIDDDDLKVVNIVKVSDGFEAFGNTKSGEFLVELGGTSSSPVVVEYQVFNTGDPDAATPGDDYTPIGTGTVTIDAFTKSKSVVVDIVNDGDEEDIENVEIKVSNVISGPYTPGASGKVQIFSDVEVSVEASKPAATEGGSDGEFKFYLNYADAPAVAATSDVDTVVSYSILTGNPDDATNGTDYAKLDGTVTIPAGKTYVSLPVDVTNDLTLEDTENVRLKITGVAGEGDVDKSSTAADLEATVSITDNDQAYFTVEATKNPGEDNPGADVDAEFTVYMSQPADVPTVVTYSIATGGAAATPGDDYAKLSGSVTIKANETSAVIPVDVFDDLDIENTETVTISLTDAMKFETSGSNPHPYASDLFLGALGTSFLADGQALQSVGATQDTFIDASLDTTNFGASPTLVVDGSFLEAQTLIQFAGFVGTGSGEIPAGSPISEALLTLDGAGFPVAIYELLIGFDDSLSTWNDPLLGGNALPGVQVGLGETDSLPTDVGFADFGLDVTPDVADWIDGLSPNFGWAILSTVAAPSFFDSLEGFVPPVLDITLDVSATVEIIDNDTATLQVISTSPAAEPGTAAEFVIGLVDGFGNLVEADDNVSYTFEDTTLAGAAPTATPGSDYPVFASTSGVLNAGDKTAVITLTPNDDSLIEPTENVSIKLLTAKSADPDITLGSKVDGATVINDNDFGFVTIDVAETVDGAENNGGTPSHGSFVVSISTPSSTDTVISLDTLASSTAKAGMDYVALPSTVTIPASQTSTIVPVTVLEDSMNETNPETVNVQLTGKVSGNAAIALGSPVQETIEILDDEQTLEVSSTAPQPIAIEQLPGTTASQDGLLRIQQNFFSDEPTVVWFTITGTAEDDDPAAVTGGVEPDYDATQFPGLDLVSKPIDESKAGTDLMGKITIPVGTKWIDFPVDVFNDYVVDSPEDIVLTVTKVDNANGVSAVGGPATVTIQDGVYEVSVEKTDSPAAEPGPAAGSNGQFTFSITAPLPEDTVVYYELLGTSTAQLDVDFKLAGYDSIAGKGTVVIPANATQVTLDVEVIDDSLVEELETVDIQILPGAFSAGGSYVYGAPTILEDATPAQETIVDDDVATLKVEGVDGTESGQPSLSSDGKFVITQSLKASQPTVVEYEVFDGSADAGDDYVAIGKGTATIPANVDNTTWFYVDVLDDTTIEGTEDVNIKLVSIKSGDPDVSFATKTASLDIIDDDSGSVSILGISNGFEPGTNDGKFVVTLTNPSATDTVVTFSPNAGDATMGDDFILRDGSSTGPTITNQITVPANQTQAFIVVDVLDDGVIEDAETVKFSLVSTDNAKISPAAGEASISIVPDNDQMKVNIAGTQDGNEAGATPGEFTLTLTDANPGTVLPALFSDEPTVVTYTILPGGTATNPGSPGADHGLAITGKVTIDAFKTQATISVPIVNDNLAELTEDLQVEITSVDSGHTSHIGIGAKASAIDILDDDASKLTISSPTVDEEDGTITFVVTNPSDVDTGVGSTFDVNFSVTDVTTNKVGPTDYTAVTTSPISIGGAAGSTTTVVFNITNDNWVEADETFKVKLTGASIAPPLVVTGAEGVGTISNTDEATFKVQNAALDSSEIKVIEGTSDPLNPGLDATGFTPLDVYVTLDNPIDVDTVVDIDFGDLTAFGGDFDPVLSLASPNNVLPVTHDGGFDYDNDASEDDQSSAKYTNGTISSLLFKAGSLTSTVPSFTVRVVQDSIVEGGSGTKSKVNDPGEESFDIAISADTAGIRNIDTEAGTGTIIDDDSATITLSASSDLKASEPADTVDEGDAQFIIVQSNVSDTDTVITYDVSGTADHKGSDYVPLTGTVTIEAGKTSAVVDVVVEDSVELEDDETVTITLTGFTSRDPNVDYNNDSVGLSQTAVIFDDDQAEVTVEASDPDASEDPDDDGEFTLTLSGVSDTDTVVNYVMLNPTVSNPDRATNGADYKFLPGSVTIPAGKTQTTITVDVQDDVEVEGAEDVIIELTGTSSPSNADIDIGADKTATVVIADDIDGVLISVMNNGDAIEGTGAVPSIPGSFVVKLTKDDGVTPVAAPVGGLTVNYSSAGGTATPGAGSTADYTALTGTLFIPAGATTGLIDVAVNNDAVVEGTETVKVTLQPPIGGYPDINGEDVNVGQGDAIVNIIDDDSISPMVESVTLTEGEDQRSAIKTIEVVFDQPVNVASGAIKVMKRDDLPGGLVTVGEADGVVVSTPDYASQPGKTVVNLTFTPGSTFVNAAGGLEDGNYQVEIDGMMVTSIVGGNFLDGDSDGIGGGDYVFGDEISDEFYVLYGDADGDGDVDFADMFGLAFPEVGTNDTMFGFADHLDGDLDGDIDFADLFDHIFGKVGTLRDTGGF